MERFYLTKEAALLKAKEEWAHKIAGAVVAGRRHSGINFNIAVNAARCASLWVDDFKRQ